MKTQHLKILVHFAHFLVFFKTNVYKINYILKQKEAVKQIVKGFLSRNITMFFPPLILFPNKSSLESETMS